MIIPGDLSREMHSRFVTQLGMSADSSIYSPSTFATEPDKWCHIPRWLLPGRGSLQCVCDVHLSLGLLCCFGNRE